MLYTRNFWRIEGRPNRGRSRQHSLPLMQQAFLYGDMGDDVVYIRQQDWWPEPIPEGHCLQLLKRAYWAKQVAHRLHIHISSWMESQGCSAVDSEMIIFMKRQGSDFIFHGLFVDNMMHVCKVSSSDVLHWIHGNVHCRLIFKIIGCSLTETFMGMEVQNTNNTIKIHLDHCINETLTEYKDYITKTLRPKKVQI
jgi:hypothetical protein